MTTIQPSKETVIIVHGTFAAPKDGETQWYQLGTDPTKSGRFVQQLDHELEKAGSSARCWAHCNHPSQIFTWSGDNSWDARYRASIELFHYLNDILSDGWKVYVIAHSHGGNILLELITLFKLKKYKTEGLLGIITIGTPFIESRALIDSYLHDHNTRNIRVIGSFMNLSIKFQKWNLLIISLFSIFLLAGSAIIEYSDKIIKLTSNLSVLNSAAILIIFIFLYLFTIFKFLWNFIITYENKFLLYAFDQFRNNGVLVPTLVEHEDITNAPFLCINSASDEAWMFLHHICNLKKIPTSIINHISYVKTQFLKSIERKRLKFDVLGAKFHENIVYRKCFILIQNPISLCVYFTINYHYFITSLLPASFIVSDLQFFKYILCILLVWPLQYFLPFTSYYPLSKNQEAVRYYLIYIEALAEIPRYWFSYRFYKKSYDYLASYALGTQDFFKPVLDVSIKPTGIKCVFENIPSSALDYAIQKRKKWLSVYFDKAENLFQQTIISDSQLSEFLKSIERDQSLVHSVYYTHVDCINQIASWITSRKHDALAN